MKKSLILLTVLLLAGALAFAEDVTPTWSISLSAETIVGYDFNVSKGGITNSPTTDFSFYYYPKATWAKGGEGGVYGMIEAKDVVWGIINDTWNTQSRLDTGAVSPNYDKDYYSQYADDIKNSAGTLTAKIVWNSLYLLISRGSDDMEFDYAPNADGYVDVNFQTLETLLGLKNTLAVGYTSDMISGRFTVLSVGDWASIIETAQVDKTDAIIPFIVGKAHTDHISPRTASNDFAFGLWLTVNPIKMLSVDAKAIADFYQEWMGFGANVTLKPIDLITIAVPFDAFNDTAASDFYFDVKPALTVNLGDDALTGSLYYCSADDPAIQASNEMDVTVKFVEADGDAGYVPGLGASAEATLENLTAATGYEMGYTVDLKANYTYGAWKPYAEFKMSPYNLVTDHDTMLKLNAGITYTGIANTTITLDYVATDLSKVAPSDATHDDYSNDKGRLSLKFKIAY